MGMAGALARQGAQAGPLGGKTPWQEQASGVEFNTQTEVGLRVFFQSWKNKDDFIISYFSSLPEIVA